MSAPLTATQTFAPAWPPAEAQAPPPPVPPTPPVAAVPVAPPPPPVVITTPPPAAPVQPPPMAYAPPPPPSFGAPADLPPAEAGRKIPAWLVMLLALAGIVGLLAVLYLYVLPSKSTTASTVPAAATGPAAASGAAGKPVSPFAKYLEVGGVRVNEDAKGKAQVQFIVVNHSPADLPELNMNITVKSADKVLFTFPYKAPALGPFESKEASTSLDTNLKPYELPDWQFVKAEFLITTPADQ